MNLHFLFLQIFTKENLKSSKKIEFMKNTQKNSRANIFHESSRWWNFLKYFLLPLWEKMKLRKGFAYIMREPKIFFFWSHLSVCFPFLPQSRLSFAVFPIRRRTKMCGYKATSVARASSSEKSRASWKRKSSSVVRMFVEIFFPQITPTTKTTKKIAILHFLA